LSCRWHPSMLRRGRSPFGRPPDIFGVRKSGELLRRRQCPALSDGNAICESRRPPFRHVKFHHLASSLFRFELAAAVRGPRLSQGKQKTPMDFKTPSSRNFSDSSWTSRESPDFRNDFTWTAGSDPNVSHTRLVDLGGSGEVHEVLSALSLSNRPDVR